MRIAMSAMLLLATTAILAQNPQPDQSADQLRDLAKQARKSGDHQGEASYLCQAARMDAKKHQKKCEKAIEDLQKDAAAIPGRPGYGTRGNATQRIRRSGARPFENHVWTS
jgi:hypothetical protein